MEAAGDKALFLPPPEYQPKGANSAERKSLLLRCYACAVSVILVLVLIGGAVFIAGKYGESKEDITLSISPQTGKMVEVDETHLTDTFYKPGPNGSVVVLDYKQGSMGVYMKEADMCMVAAGLHIHKHQGADQRYPSAATHLLLVTDDQDSNPGLLPARMTSLCAEKRVVHMRTANAADMPTEQKHGAKGSRVKRGCQRRCRCQVVCRGGSGCHTECSCSIECSF